MIWLYIKCQSICSTSFHSEFYTLRCNCRMRQKFWCPLHSFMDLDEIIAAFADTSKGPLRTYPRRDYGDVALYHLPNGVCIFEVPDGIELQEGRTYQPAANGLSFDFKYRVIEIQDRHAIIQRLSFHDAALPVDTPEC
ncbi:hypothetical protein PAPHI01_2246 [Pancytospora philotis]|nr:hypothetical protein PAPHI01_2246 [Pancytospora philotis]